MILVDANLLIYAHVVEMREHGPAKAWLEGELNDGVGMGLPWHSIHAFLRIVTNPKVFRRPDSADAAWRQVEEWLACSSVWIPIPTERHRAIFGELMTRTGTSGNLVSDAHIAALAVEHGLSVRSCDTDFARFPEVSWENPLA